MADNYIARFGPTPKLTFPCEICGERQELEGDYSLTSILRICDQCKIDLRDMVLDRRNSPEIKVTISELIIGLDKLTDEERYDIISEYCDGCGSKEICGCPSRYDD